MNRPAIDLTESLALMGPAALVAHIRAACAELGRHSADLTPAQYLLWAEVDEACVTFEGRADRQALANRLARMRREDGEEAYQ